MTASLMDLERFRAEAATILSGQFAPWVQQLGLELTGVAPLQVRLTHRAELCRSGGILCGQALMAAADTAMVLAVAHALGGFTDMATVTMTTQFLAPLIGEDAMLTVELPKLGRTLAFGEARFVGADSGRACAQASLVYALIRR